ncbi:MAG: hypothetical protein ACI9EW_001300 [Cellvibrionaceae bacterium]|jgi:hypothetical protein
MTQNKWSFPLIILAVLMVTGLLTVIVPTISRGIGNAFASDKSSSSHIEIPSAPVYQENVTLMVDGYLVGEELIKIPALGEFNSKSETERTYTSPSLLAVLTALVVGGLIAFTIPIAGLGYLASRSSILSGEDKSHDESVNNLENKAKAWYKAENEIKPVTGKPKTHERPARDGWAAGLIVVFMAYFFGYVMGEGISVGSGGTIGSLCFFVAIIGGYFYFRPERMEAVESTSAGTVNYGVLWVFLSGAVVMGLGIGLIFVVTSGGDPFPWLTWEPGPRIDWQFISDWFAESGLNPADWN